MVVRKATAGRTTKSTSLVKEVRKYGYACTDYAIAPPVRQPSENKFRIV